MINFAQVSKGFIIKEPMQAAIFQNLLSLPLQKELTTSYPTENFKLAERQTAPGKLYRFSMLSLVENGKWENSILDADNILNPTWKKFINCLLDEKYTQALSSKLNIDLSKSVINIGLYRFGINDYVEPHIDHERKIVTQLFYFNTHWDINNGGFLQLSCNKDLDNCFLKLPPLSIYSVALIRSLSAWHSVMPISSVSTQSRLSLQLEYYQKS